MRGLAVNIMSFIREYAVVLILMTFVVSSVAYLFSKGKSEQRTLRWAHVYEVNTPYHKQALQAARAFEEKTNGRYRILVFPASTLGKEAGLNEAIQLGAVDMIYTGATLASADYPPLVISDYPYTIESYQHWKAYRNSELFNELVEGYKAETGNTIIAPVYYGFRHVTSNRPILSPEDMVGLKIRVPNSPAFLLMPKAVGANPSPMPFSEVYLGLQQGVVDAQENPLPTIKFKRFYEVQTNINLTSHMSNTLLVMVSKATRSRLSPNDYELLTQELRLAAERASDAIFNQEEELKGWFEEQGLTINNTDREAFQRLVLEKMNETDKPFSDNQLKRLKALVPHD